MAILPFSRLYTAPVLTVKKNVVALVCIEVALSSRRVWSRILCPFCCSHPFCYQTEVVRRLYYNLPASVWCDRPQILSILCGKKNKLKRKSKYSSGLFTLHSSKVHVFVRYERTMDWEPENMPTYLMGWTFSHRTQARFLRQLTPYRDPQRKAARKIKTKHLALVAGVNTQHNNPNTIALRRRATVVNSCFSWVETWNSC